MPPMHKWILPSSSFPCRVGKSCNGKSGTMVAALFGVRQNAFIGGFAGRADSAGWPLEMAWWSIRARRRGIRLRAKPQWRLPLLAADGGNVHMAPRPAVLLGENRRPTGAARHFTLGENGRSPVRQIAIDGGVESTTVGSRLAVSSADLYSGRGHIVDQVLVGHPPERRTKRCRRGSTSPCPLRQMKTAPKGERSG